MRAKPARHMWALMINNVQIGLWPEDGMALLRLPANVPDDVREYIGRIVHRWLRNTVGELAERKGT